MQRQKTQGPERNPKKNLSSASSNDSHGEYSKPKFKPRPTNKENKNIKKATPSPSTSSSP